MPLSQSTPRKLLGLAFLGAIIFSVVAAYSVAGTIVGTKHDLSSSGGGNWGSTDTDRVCIFCHTPHNANATVSGPLWNRYLPTASYQLYQSATLDAVVGQPQGETLLCLSCHDGVMALNVLYSPPGGTNPTMDPNGDQLGDVYYPGSPYTSGSGGNGLGPNVTGNVPGQAAVNDLSNDHPVSFVFDASLVAQDPGLRLPPAGSRVQLYGPSKNRLECPSCHNVHDDTYAPFLVQSNAGSSLCFVCHAK